MGVDSPEGPVGSGQPRISVAVCTRNRAWLLSRALDSLQRQTVAPLEVLVVDNAPDDHTTRDLASSRPAVRYLLEPRRGINFARNRALAEATGEILAFLDDDAVAADGWIAAIQQVFARDARVAICTGRVEALRMDAPGHRLFEANGGFSRGVERIELPRDRARPLNGLRSPLIAWAVSVGAGNNFAVRRHVALAVGGFDIALDLMDVLPAGGDLDMFWRLLEAGHTLIYAPDALVWHEHRAEIDAVYRQLLDHQHGLIGMLTKALLTSRPAHRPGIFLFLVWRLLKPGMRLLRRATGRDPLPTPVLLRMWLRCWSGLWGYPLAARIARRRALSTTIA